MDALHFVVEMTKALAWPVAAILMALLFRTQIRELLQRMRKGKVGFAEFEFEERVRELATAAGTSLSALPPSDVRELSVATDLRAVVLVTWAQVEAEIRTLAESSGIASFERKTTSGLVDELQRAGKLSPAIANNFRDMRELRNRAAHAVEFEPGRSSVAAYVGMVSDLRSKIRDAKNAA